MKSAFDRARQVAPTDVAARTSYFPSIIAVLSLDNESTKRIILIANFFVLCFNSSEFIVFNSNLQIRNSKFNISFPSAEPWSTFPYSPSPCRCRAQQPAMVLRQRGREDWSQDEVVRQDL
jgi:hypothetical protein